MPKLTKRVVEAMVVVNGKSAYLWDEQLPSFGVKVLPSGTRKYVLKYRVGAGGRTALQRWATLGTHGAITCDQARDLAQQTLAAIAKGDDPQGQKLEARTAPTLAAVWTRFSLEQLPQKKQATARDYKQLWRDHIESELGRKFVKDIQIEMVERLHSRLKSTPYTANRVLALLSRMFNLSEKWGMRRSGSNPCRHVERNKEKSRERYLSSEELGRLGVEMEGMLESGDIYPEAVAAIRLLLLTGARRNEILTARWEWFNIEQGVIDLPDSKTGKKTVFLSSEALKVLDWIKVKQGAKTSPFILPCRVQGKPLNNLSKAWRRLCDKASISGVRLHDLRHTAASIAVGQGASLSLIGKLLGHTQVQTTQRYAHVDHLPTLELANRLGESIALSLDRKLQLKKN